MEEDVGISPFRRAMDLAHPLLQTRHKPCSTKYYTTGYSVGVVVRLGFGRTYIAFETPLFGYR